MTKILYSGIDQDGVSRSGFIDAENNHDAVGILIEKGFSKIQLHNDTVFASDRKELDGLGEDEREAIAAFEITNMKKPGTSGFLAQVLRSNRLVILVGLALIVWGQFEGSGLLMIAGAVVAAIVPAISLWNYRHARNYDRLLRACAEGRWEEAIALIDGLRPHMKAPSMAFDLDVREACIRAKRGSIEEALKIVGKWRETLHEQSPGLYESRIASVYHAAGEHHQFVELMRTAYFEASENQSMVIDLALAEARLGDVAKAEVLLRNVRAAELPSFALPFIDWVKGLVAKRNNDSQARLHLASAVSGLLAFAENPAVWTSLALCVGYYAASLPADADRHKAESLLGRMSTILSVHAEQALLEELTEKYPNWMSAGA